MSDDQDQPIRFPVSEAPDDVLDQLPEAPPVTALVSQPGVPLEQDLLQLGYTMARSGFFTDARSASQAIVKILAGRELGIAPLASMAGVFIVKNRVVLSANLMAAVIKRSGKYDYRIVEHDADHCILGFLENGESVGQSVFTMEHAIEAELTRNPTWRQYPRNMLFARAMSNGARWYCAELFGGATYTPEEVGHDEFESYDE